MTQRSPLSTFLIAVALVVACDRRAPSPHADSVRPGARTLAITDTTTPHPLTPPSDTDSAGHMPWLDSMVTPGTKFDVAVIDSVSHEVVCYIFPRYIVVNHTFPDSLGSDNFVRRRPENVTSFRPLCTPDSVAGDYVIRNGDADWYSGLYGRWLVLERETGGATTVLVHDIEALRKTAQFDGNLVKWGDSVTLFVWTSPHSVARSVCPQFSDNELIGVESLLVVDVRTSKLTRTGRWRCSIRQ
jgi:hypothetical protein